MRSAQDAVSIAPLDRGQGQIPGEGHDAMEYVSTRVLYFSKGLSSHSTTRDFPDSAALMALSAFLFKSRNVFKITSFRNSMNVPKKIEERLIQGIKRYQPIVAGASDRDIGEADTVTIIKDMLADVFGYDKYAEITGEHAIRGTFCDLALKIDGQLQILIEVKAVGIELKDMHVKQAVDYAANQGCDWVILTNAKSWRVYRVVFAKPIDNELVVDFRFQELNFKTESHLETLYLLCKEAWAKSLLGEFHAQRQVLSRYFIGALLLSETIVDCVRKELRKIAPDVKADSVGIREILETEIIKRDVFEGEKGDEARKKILSFYRKLERKKEAAKLEKQAEGGEQPSSDEKEDATSPSNDAIQGVALEHVGEAAETDNPS